MQGNPQCATLQIRAFSPSLLFPGDSRSVVVGTQQVVGIRLAPCAIGRQIIGGDASLPFPQRADLMYLDTLKSKDVPHGFTRKGTRQCGSLITRDIEGAFPENPYERLTARRDSSFKSEATSVLNRRPREGSRPTDLSLQTRDIEVSRRNWC
ncbi:hypothetical protein TGP89_311375 [Toxoplasma gondii p89]|uniref:Uncharacterized protein n=1 Tax=Toxoplasma gondii p89 TaxID=943119 RepID=A0A086J965_TOXGO|nr:hypothetical protein TGP89_311375 [Toxoplasma gondii p89]